MPHRQQRQLQCSFCPKYFETEFQLIKHVKMRNHQEMCQHHLQSPASRGSSLFERIQQELSFAGSGAHQELARESLLSPAKSASVSLHLLPSVYGKKKFGEPGCQVINKNKVSRRVARVVGRHRQVRCSLEYKHDNDDSARDDDYYYYELSDDVESSRLSERLRGRLEDLDRMLGQILASQARELACKTAGNKSADNLGLSNVIAELNDPSGPAAVCLGECRPAGSKLGALVASMTSLNGTEGERKGGAYVRADLSEFAHAEHHTGPPAESSDFADLDTWAGGGRAAHQMMVADVSNNGYKGARELDKNYGLACRRCRCAGDQDFIDCSPLGLKETIKSIARQTILAELSRSSGRAADARQQDGDKTYPGQAEAGMAQRELGSSLPDGVTGKDARRSIMDLDKSGGELIKCSLASLPDGTSEWAELEGGGDQSDWHRRSSDGNGDSSGAGHTSSLAASPTSVANYTRAPQANVDSGRSNDLEANSAHDSSDLSSIDGRKLDQVGSEEAEVEALQSTPVTGSGERGQEPAGGRADSARSQHHKSARGPDRTEPEQDYWASRPEVGAAQSLTQMDPLSSSGEPAWEQFRLTGRLGSATPAVAELGPAEVASGAAAAVTTTTTTTTMQTEPTATASSTPAQTTTASNNEPPATFGLTETALLGAKLIEGEDNDNLFRGSHRFGSPAALLAQTEPVSGLDSPTRAPARATREGSEASNMMTVPSQCGNNAPGKIYCDSNSSLDQISKDDTNVGCTAQQQSDKQQLLQQQRASPHPAESPAAHLSSDEPASGRAASLKCDSMAPESSLATAAPPSCPGEVLVHDGVACISGLAQVGQRQFEASLNSAGSSLIDRKRFVSQTGEQTEPLESAPAPDGAPDRPQVARRMGETNKSDGQSWADSQPAKGGRALGGDPGSRKSNGSDSDTTNDSCSSLSDASCGRSLLVVDQLETRAASNDAHNNKHISYSNSDTVSSAASGLPTPWPAPPPSLAPKSILKRSLSGQVQPGGSRDDPVDDRLASSNQLGGRRRRSLVRFSDTPSLLEPAVDARQGSPGKAGPGE